MADPEKVIDKEMETSNSSNEDAIDEKMIEGHQLNTKKTVQLEDPSSNTSDAASQSSKPEHDADLRPHYSRENTAISTASRVLPTLKRKETKHEK